MPWSKTAILLTALAFFAAALVMAEKNPYRASLKARRFDTQVVVLPPKTLGKTIIRKKAGVTVEIAVSIEDYLPRALEPILLINGNPAGRLGRIISVKGNITKLGFVVEKLKLLEEGAVISVQMGDDLRTWSKVPGNFSLKQVRPLQKSEVKRWKVPALPKALAR